MKCFRHVKINLKIVGKDMYVHTVTHVRRNEIQFENLVLTSFSSKFGHLVICIEEETLIFATSWRYYSINIPLHVTREMHSIYRDLQKQIMSN